MTRRVLFIDSFKGFELQNLITLSSIAEVHSLVERYSFLETPEVISLDLRVLNLKAVTSLLKFIEEYQGDLYVVINDPVPLPVLSRFIEIHKSFTPNKTKSFMNIVIDDCVKSNNLKTKLYNFFDVPLQSFS